MNNQQKPLSAMLSLMRQNMGAFIGAMLSTIAIVLIGFATPLLMAETIDCVLGTQPSSLPEFILAPIRALGGREFLQRSLWAVGLALVGLNLINGVFTLGNFVAAVIGFTAGILLADPVKGLLRTIFGF